MVRGALALFEATGEEDYLTAAKRLVAAAEAAFADPHGGFFTTAVDAADVPLTRPRSAADDATPSGSGMMAEVLARLYHLTGEPGWRTRAEAVLRSFAGQPDQLAGMPTLLAAADLLEEAAAVVVAGTDPAVLAAVALQAPDPAVVVLRATDTAALPASHPAFGKNAGPGDSAAFVCRRNVCGLPVTEPTALAQTLRTRV